MQAALSIAGSDSIGGAGIQADIKAFASLGVHGTTVITAITAQNTKRVAGIFPLSWTEISSQLEAVLEDAEVAASKTGMLYSPEIVSSLAERLEKEAFPIVVDPVMVAGVGDSLATEGLSSAIKEHLLPISTIITPNKTEAEALVGFSLRNKDDIESACRSLKEMGAKSVLIKGGHFQGEFSIDTLLVNGRIYELSSPRLDARGHGGGCILSAYITACLAKGMNVREAVGESKHRIFDAIRAHYSVGKGVTVVDSLATLEREAEKYEVMVRLRRAIKDLLTVLPSSWIPEVGINFAFALPCASGLAEVCAMEGRIINVSGCPRQTGDVAYGASQHVATVILTAMQFDPQIRSVLNVRYNEENVKCFESAGLVASSFERAKEPKAMSTMEWGTLEAIRKMGIVPDIVFDKGGVGKEPMIRILGRSPEDVIMKLKGALS